MHVGTLAITPLWQIGAVLCIPDLLAATSTTSNWPCVVDKWITSVKRMA